MKTNKKNTLRVYAFLAITLFGINVRAAVIYPNELPQDFSGTLLSYISSFEVLGSSDGRFGSFAAFSVNETSLGQGYLLRYGLASSSDLTGNLWAYVSSSYSLNGNDQTNHNIHLYFDDLNVSPWGFSQYHFGHSGTTFFFSDDALLSVRGYDYVASERPIPDGVVNMDTGALVCLADCFTEIGLKLAYVQFIDLNGAAQISFSSVSVPSSTLFKMYSGGFQTDENGEYTIYSEGVTSLNIAPIPVPASLWLFISAFAGLLAAKSRVVYSSLLPYKQIRLRTNCGV